MCVRMEPALLWHEVMNSVLRPYESLQEERKREPDRAKAAHRC